MKRTLILGALLACPATAFADGDATLGLTLFESGRGYGVASAGVGLAGRRDGVAPSVPSTSETIELRGVPDDAAIRHAYLYWVVYGDSDASVTLDGAAVTGTLIGSDVDTCWGREGDGTYLGGEGNGVYRADVTPMVEGNGDFVLSGFPSYATSSDSQGAALVVVYDDPARDDTGTVVIRDGADVVKADSGAEVTFDEIPALTATGGFLHAGVGDAQVLYLDGLMRFNGTSMSAPDGMQHYAQRSGPYWESLTYDLGARDVLEDIGPTTRFSQAYGQDCLVFAYLALDIRSVLVDPDDDGVDAVVDNCDAVANPGQENSDGDTFGDACDNCPAADNETQQDADDDGAGDLCDSCELVANPDQEDCDGDGVGDVCDNCPMNANPTQIDLDGNGVGEDCEDAPPDECVVAPGDDDDDDAGVGDDDDDDAGVGDDDDDDSGDDDDVDAGSDGGSRATDDGGCGCGVPGRAPLKGSAAALVLFALVAVRRRRRAR